MSQEDLHIFLENKAIKALLIDKESNIWIGTDEGVFTGSLKSELLAFKHYQYIEGDDHSLSNNSITGISEDQQGRIWIATFGNGICYFNKANQKFIRLDRSLLSSRQTRFVHPAKNGELWVGTTSIDIVDESLKNSTRLKQASKFEDILHQAVANAIYEDQAGAIWLGTSGGGLMKYTAQTEELVVYTTSHGLPSNVIQSITKDVDGNLWVGTNKGIAVLDLEQQLFKSFNRLDGLQGEEFNFNAIYANKKGEVFFGGLYGLNVLEPSQLEQNHYVPPVYIDKLFIKYQRQKPKQSEVLPQSLQTMESIELTTDQNILRFDFVALSYRNPIRNQYAYRLYPFEKEWVYTSAYDRKAVYMNLPAGDYRLEVKGANDAGVWNDTGDSVEIHIQAKWWDTIWGNSLFVGLITLLFLLLMRVRTRRLEYQKKSLEALVAERTNELIFQKDEVVTQNEELQQMAEEASRQRDQIEEQNREYQSFLREVEIVSEVGKRITTLLATENLFRDLYDSVNSMVNAPTFGIGRYNAIDHRLDFKEIDGENEAVSKSYDSLNDTDKLSVQCFTGLKEIIILNLESEKDVYGVSEELLERERNRSVIYLPLVASNKKIGVMTVQSPEYNAYEKREINVLRALSSYIAITIDNAKNFQELKTKNLLITDSIRYAESIQQAILPNPRMLSQAFADHFVMYKPKDIVSGDFFWYTQKADTHFMVLADCTGHGVPGALMSMVGTRILDEEIVQKEIRGGDEILEGINQSIRVVLKQNESSETDLLHTNMDGMDAALLKISYAEDGCVDLAFAGAKLSLYYQDGDTITRLRGDKRSLGGYQWSDKPFTEHYVRLKKGTRVFMTTDGFLHQNSPNYKKVGRTAFMRLLSQSLHLPISEQEAFLLNYLKKHQANVEQRDDITVLGLQF